LTRAQLRQSAESITRFMWRGKRAPWLSVVL
jgi:hypothetical protein